jgi:hypothetical protein
MDITAEQIIREQSRLEEERRVYERLKQLCVEMTYPGRSDCWELTAGDEGKSNARKIYDPTGTKGLDIWSNGIIGNWMPKDINWFMEQMEDRKLKNVKTITKWLQDVDDHLRFVLGRTNYYEQKLVSVRDSGCIGDSFMYIEEERDTGKQLFLCPHPREFWLIRDFWGRVCGIHHKFMKTLKQIQEEFGADALNEEQNRMIAEKPDYKIEVIYAIYKNTDYQANRIGVKNMRWNYNYLNKDAKKLMLKSIGGRTTINPIPWSLNRPSHEVYGRGVVSQLLIEILTANFMAKDILLASQQATRPAMLASKALKNNLSLSAGALNFVASRDMQGVKMGDLISKIVDTSGYPFGIDNHERWQKAIEDRFGVPIFMALNSPNRGQRTAYEVQQMRSEQIALMSPFIGTLGLTTDMELDRIFAIEFESGRAPEPPEELYMAQNSRINIEYIGPLSQMLKQYYETGNLLTTISNIQAAASVVPGSMDIVNGDELMRKILRSGNTPEDIIFSNDEVNEIRAIQQQQNEAMMQAKLAKESASVVPNISKKIEDGSILDMLKGEAA